MKKVYCSKCRKLIAVGISETDIIIFCLRCTVENANINLSTKGDMFSYGFKPREIP